MKFLKNNIKLIIVFMVGVLLASGITGYAATTYLASNVQYTNNKTVANALDDLYIVASTYKNLNQTTNAIASDILSGKTAYNNNGQLITGTAEKDWKVETKNISGSNITNYVYNLGYTPRYVFFKVTFDNTSGEIVWSNDSLSTVTALNLNNNSYQDYSGYIKPDENGIKFVGWNTSVNNYSIEFWTIK